MPELSLKSVAHIAISAAIDTDRQRAVEHLDMLESEQINDLDEAIEILRDWVDDIMLDRQAKWIAAAWEESR